MTMEKKIHEIWLPIPGYEYYEASDQQRIRSVDKVVRHNYGGNCEQTTAGCDVLNH